MRNKNTRDRGKPYDRPEQPIMSRIRSTASWLVPEFLKEFVSNLRGDAYDAFDDDDATPSTRWSQTPPDLSRHRYGIPMEATTDRHGPPELPATRMPMTYDPIQSTVSSTVDGRVHVECDGYHATFDPAVLSDDRGANSSSLGTRPPLSSARSPSPPLPPSPTLLRHPSQAQATRLAASRRDSPSAKRTAQMSHDEDVALERGDANAEEFDDDDFNGSVATGGPTKKRQIELPSRTFAGPTTSYATSHDAAERGRRLKGDSSFLWSTKATPPPSAYATPSSDLRLTSSRSYSAAAASASARAPFTVGRPTFDANTFSATMNRSYLDASNASSRASAFYPGKTTYGGASARSNRSSPAESSYQVLPSVRHEVRVTPLATSREAPLSSTARLILEGMQRNETTSNREMDVPSYRSSQFDSPLSFSAPSTYKRLSLQPTLNQPSPKRGPPTYERNVPTAAIIRQSYATYNRPSETTATAGTLLARKTDDLQSNSMRSEAPGKMRIGQQSRHHYSSSSSSAAGKASTSDEKMDTAVQLPSSVRLPAMNFLPMPGIVATSDPGSSGGSERTAFRFSEPTNLTEDHGTVNLRNKQSFQFQSPIYLDAAPAPMDTTTMTTPRQPPPATMSAQTLAFKFNTETAVRRPPSFSSENPSSSNAAESTSLKSGSVLDILGKASGLATTTTTTTSSSSSSSPVTVIGMSTDKPPPLMELFKKPSGDWNCQDCLVPNKMADLVCVCCGGKKPEAKDATTAMTSTIVTTTTSQVVTTSSSGAPPLLSSMFSQHLNSWTCKNCFVQNQKNAARCICCEDPNPSAVVATAIATTARQELKPGTSSDMPPLTELFKKPSGDWNCQDCLVTNKMADVVCVCCGGKNPTAKDATGTAGGFQLNSATSNFPPKSTFTPSAPGSANVPTTGGFKMDFAANGGGFQGFGAHQFGTRKGDVDVPSSGSVATSRGGGGFKPTGFGFTAPTSNGGGQTHVKDADAATKPPGFGFSLKTIAGMLGDGSESRDDRDGKIVVRPPLRSPEKTGNQESVLGASSSPLSDLVQTNPRTSGSVVSSISATVSSSSSGFGFAAAPAVAGKRFDDVDASGFFFANRQQTSSAMPDKTFKFGGDVVDATKTASTSIPLDVDFGRGQHQAAATTVNVQPTTTTSVVSATFTFGQSQPAKEAVKPGGVGGAFGFTTATPPVNDANKPTVNSLFTFGQSQPANEAEKKPVSAVVVGGFIFGQTAKTGAFQFGQTQPVKDDRGTGNVVGFNFGQTRPPVGDVDKPGSNPNPFTFGAAREVDKPSGVVSFNFGATMPPARDDAANVSAFGFASSQATKDEKKQPATSGGLFAFGPDQNPPPAVSRIATPTTTSNPFVFSGTKNNNANSSFATSNPFIQTRPAGFAVPTTSVAVVTAPPTVPGVFRFGASAPATAGGVFTFGARPSQQTSAVATNPPEMTSAFLGKRTFNDNDDDNQKRKKPNGGESPMVDDATMNSRSPQTLGTPFAFGQLTANNNPTALTGFNFAVPVAPLAAAGGSSGFFQAKAADQAVAAGTMFGSVGSGPSPAPSFVFGGSQPAMQLSQGSPFGAQIRLSNGALNSAAPVPFVPTGFGATGANPTGFNFASGVPPTFTMGAGSMPSTTANRTIRKAVRRTTKK